MPSLAVSGSRSEFEYAITCFKPFQPKNEDAPVMESSSGIVPDETSSMPLYSLKFLPSTVSAILSPLKSSPIVAPYSEGTDSEEFDHMPRILM